MTDIGPRILDGSCAFRVWAPLRNRVDLHIVNPVEKVISMTRDRSGYWSVDVEGVGEGTLYRYRLDNSLERPDPASPSQPEGVHGPSAIVDHRRFAWKDEPPSTNLTDYIMYELHIGTFTEHGTFASAAARLSDLEDLGINAVEVMPVAQFPGKRNWGYDGVYPFAVQNSYGGVDGFKGFINEAHRRGVAVILDVVYNHLGPEGNYLRDFGAYFTDRYKTPWGESLNFDGEYSDEVCDYFIENALYWLRTFHVDALRIDAAHAIYDMGAHPFLQRLAEAVEKDTERTGIRKYLIAESDLNDSRIIRNRERGGFAIDAQWSDDFHHSLHCLLTGESRGYYADFGNVDHMVRTLRRSFCYSGNYSVFRKRRHGNDVSDFHTGRFVVCSQNHDQVGNRMLGERLITLTDFERAKLAAAAVLLSPYIPLLFMGEEHAEESPFLYFADHSDQHLRNGVREGRKSEFAQFHASGDPLDPFDLHTFERSKLNWERRRREPYSIMYRFYKELIRVRKSCPAIAPCARERLEIVRHGDKSVVSIRYWGDMEPAVCQFNFGEEEADFEWNLKGQWKKIFDSKTADWSAKPAPLPEEIDNLGPTLRMAPYQCAVYIKKQTPDQTGD